MTERSGPLAHPGKAVNLRALWCLAVVLGGTALLVKIGGIQPGDSRVSTAAVVSFAGMCDASGALRLSDRTVAVVDDESNLVRVYDARRGGAPLNVFELSAALAPDGRAAERETDLEAAVALGERTFWLGSHGASRKGKRKLERHVLFATRGPRFELSGRVYRSLLDDLASDPRYARLGLSTRGPQAAHGVNIEGLAQRREGGLWIAFRSPRPQGRALLAALENPEAVVQGERPRFGAPALLDLGGRGIREIVRSPDGYLIAAGSADDDRTLGKLYRWPGGAAPRPSARDVTWLTPEAVVVDAAGQVLLLSDDGSERRLGFECKRAPAFLRSFRGVWLAPGS